MKKYAKSNFNNLHSRHESILRISTGVEPNSGDRTVCQCTPLVTDQGSETGQKNMSLQADKFEIAEHDTQKERDYCSSTTLQLADTWPNVYAFGRARISRYRQQL